MQKKKIRTKTPEYTKLIEEFKEAEKSSNYFWKFTDVQIEKISKKLNKTFDSRLDEWDCVKSWWTSKAPGDVTYRVDLKAIMNAFEIHTVQRIFMDEEHVVEWEEEPGPKGKFEWEKDEE